MISSSPTVPLKELSRTPEHYNYYYNNYQLPSHSYNNTNSYHQQTPSLRIQLTTLLIRQSLRRRFLSRLQRLRQRLSILTQYPLKQLRSLYTRSPIARSHNHDTNRAT